MFHFSGRGSQVPNQNQDDGPEDDGMDETIWPADIRFDAKRDGEVNNYSIYSTTCGDTTPATLIDLAYLGSNFLGTQDVFGRQSSHRDSLDGSISLC